MSRAGDVLGDVGNATTIALGAAAILGGLLLAVPLGIAIVTMLMATSILAFSLVPFHVDAFDLDNVEQGKRQHAEHQHKVLRGSRRMVRIVCPVVFLVIFLGTLVWTHAPSWISDESRSIIQNELARPSANEAVRYIAGPAVGVVRAPQQVGAPVVAPEPSVESLRSRREIAALPLTFVLSRAIGDAYSIFGPLAWWIFFISLIIGFVIWFSDQLNFRQYVGPPGPPINGPPPPPAAPAA